MRTIQKNITIPQDHKLHVDVSVPEDIPAGEAELVMIISPLAAHAGKGNLSSLAGRLADSPNFSRNPLAIQRELRDEWE